MQLLHIAGVFDGASLYRILLCPYVDFITKPPMGGATRIFSRQSFDRGTSEPEEVRICLSIHTPITPPSVSDVSCVMTYFS